MDAMRELRLDDDAFAELSAEILRQGGSFRFKARGSSMSPFIRDGDLLTIGPADAASLEVGEVAFYRTHRDRIIAHRVVGRATQAGVLVLETRGDARLTSDCLVPGDRVLGRVVRIRRGGRVFYLDRGPWLLVARVWIRVLPLRRAVARLARAVKGVALRLLQRLQSAGLYRRLARKAIGAHASCRLANARDAADLARLFGQEALPGIPEPIAAMVERPQGAEGGGFALIATFGERPAGGLLVRRFPEDESLYPGWWLLGPMVRARYRRAGIGERLLRLALERAVTEGATRVHLLAFEDDRATRGLCRKAGFLPAAIPALEAELVQPAGQGERRRIILCCGS
jgi:GNAT superfamily N-acetyltransferase